MKDFKDFLIEGVYDKHIFKAFWLAGGPGSGKSWVAARTLEGSGMKVINSDKGLDSYLLDVPEFIKTISEFLHSTYNEIKNEKRI